jgi:hypothetical protein
MCSTITNQYRPVLRLFCRQAVAASHQPGIERHHVEQCPKLTVVRPGDDPDLPHRLAPRGEQAEDTMTVEATLRLRYVPPGLGFPGFWEHRLVEAVPKQRPIGGTPIRAITERFRRMRATLLYTHSGFKANTRTLAA